MSDVEPTDDDILNEVLGEPNDEIGSDAVQDGKLVDKEPEAETTEAQTDATATQQVDDNAPQVPSWRLREINEEKRALAAERDALLAEKSNWQRQAPKQEQPKVEKSARPDPLLDPDGYAEAIRTELREEALTERRNESMAKALEDNPDEFKQAYKAATENGVIPELKARMNSARDPGKELLKWHKEQRDKAEIGNDLVAYRQRLRDELLKDPEFRKQATETWQSQTQHSDGRPRTSLPPSLNAASRANTTLKSTDDDVDDATLFTELAG